MRLNAIKIIVLVTFASLFSCSGGKEDVRSLMVSLPPQKYALDKIVGGRFEVGCMLEKGGSAEDYDPTMTQMAQLERCRAYFLIGNLAFEQSVKSRLADMGGKVAEVDSSEGIETIEDSEHGEIDPHVWLSVKNMRIMAKNMVEAVKKLDSGNSLEYDENYRRFDSELVALSDSLKQKLNSVRGRAFVVWHPSLTYFARDYGLVQVSIEREGKETPMRYVENQLALARELGAEVFLLQNGADHRQAIIVGGGLPIRSAEINPLSYDWKKEMMHIADELTK